MGTVLGTLGIGHRRASWALVSPNPHNPLRNDALQATANALAPLAGGRKEIVQAALDYLEGGPADRLPELPPDYVAPDPNATLSEIRKGWGSKAEENLKLARAVIAVYDAQKQGALTKYLNETGAGNDPRVIRLAARTARQWIKAGWRP